MSRLVRTLSVVALLVALASVAGAVTGVLLLVGFGLVSGDATRLAGNVQPLAMAAGLGAAVGAVTGPPIAFTLLRRVPIWRATIETAAAGGVGAAIGMSLSGVPFGWAYGGLLFALLGAFRLRRAYAKRDANSRAPTEKTI